MKGENNINGEFHHDLSQVFLSKICRARLPFAVVANAANRISDTAYGRYHGYDGELNKAGNDSMYSWLAKSRISDSLSTGRKGCLKWTSQPVSLTNWPAYDIEIARKGELRLPQDDNFFGTNHIALV